MNDGPIFESGMQFGPYKDGHCFHVEKSQFYASIQDGIQIAELVLLKANATGAKTLFIIEAKSSTPSPGNAQHFQQFVDEIRSKLLHGFLIVNSLRLPRHAKHQQDLPDPFKEVDLSSANYRFALVVNGHKKEWLPPLQEAIYRSLSPLIKIWNISPNAVIVFNHELAEKHGIAKPVEPQQ